VFFTTFLKDKYGLVLFLAALAYIIVLIRSDLVQNSRLDNEKKMMQKSFVLETTRSADLKNKMRLLNKNSYIEILAREKLGVVQKGERPYKVIIKQ
jgi:cell division protein FtsB